MAGCAFPVQLAVMGEFHGGIMDARFHESYHAPAGLQRGESSTVFTQKPQPDRETHQASQNPDPPPSREYIRTELNQGVQQLYCEASFTVTTRSTVRLRSCCVIPEGQRTSTDSAV